MAPIDTTNAFSERLREIGDRQREVARLLAAPDEDQRERGYYHTLREILQQPLTWIHTGDQMAGVASRLQASLAGVRNLFLTGSGSSEYAGHCVRLALQKRLGANTLAIGGGALLTHSRQQLPPERPALMVSIARSGDSPESVGAVSLLLESEPEVRHLVLTCNARGKLATNFAGDARVQVVTLHDETNDRSLVMTSSFTNLVIAAYFLGLPQDPALYQSQCRQLSAVADHLFDVHFGTLARIGSSDFKRAVFLGSGSRLGATLEASLKMLEM